MSLSKEEFAAMLTPQIFQFLRDTIRAGINDYNDGGLYSPIAKRDHNKSVAAVIRHCHMIGHAKRALVDSPELKIRYKRAGQRDIFVLDNKVRIFYKKLRMVRGKKRPNNHTTRQSEQILAQLWPYEHENSSQSQIETPQLWSDQEIPPQMTNVIAGYLANESETTFELCVICPSGNDNVWELTLDEEKVIELASATQEEVSQEVVSKVRQRLQPFVIRPDAISKKHENENHG